MRMPRPFRFAACSFVLLFFCLCIFVPLGAVLARAFGSRTVLAGLFDPVLIAIVKATIWQAVWSTGLSALVGLPLGLWVGAKAARGSLGSRMCQFWLALPYGIPTVVAGLTGVIWLGRSGILTGFGLQTEWLYSLKAVILAHVFFNAPWIALGVAEARWRVPEEELEAARVLGAGFFGRLLFIVWPYLKWVLASYVVQVFSLCTLSFALVLLLGGGPPVDTIETAIYARMRYSSLDVGGAVACAIWELFINLLPWAVVLWFQSQDKSSFVAARSRSFRPKASRRPCNQVSKYLMVFLCALFSLPYFVMIFTCPWSVFLKGENLSELLRPALISVELAIYASMAAVVTGLVAVAASASISKKLPRIAATLNFLLALPSGMSVLVLGLGFWLAYGRWLDPFEGSFAAMAILQATIFLPLTFRTLWPLALSMEKSLLEAALTLGASPWRAFLVVEWPRWRGPVLSSAAVVGAASLGEVAAVSLFYSEKLVPLPLLLTRWMGQYRFAEAEGLAALLFLLSAVTVGFVMKAHPQFSLE